MTSATKTTLIEMVDSLPDALQERLVEHLREYIADLQDEIAWNESFAKSQDKLVAAARKAKREIAAGLATPLDPEQL